jgi:cellobiose phosphorylase
MRYGHFDDHRREYIITRPDTPLPWINYLGTEDYLALISNTGGGYSFYRDARLRRLTRYRYNNVPADQGSRFLYLRDNDPGRSPQAPLFWCPTGQPARQALDSYECRHGLGYTILRSTFADIDAQVRFFVPRQETLELWEVTVTNHRPDPAHLSLFSAVEFCLWDALDDATNFQRNLSVGEVEVADRVIYHKSEYRERRNHFAYFACSDKTAGFDTQREAFLGPYRGWDRPLAVETGRASDSLATGWQPIGAHHVRLELDPGQCKTLVFILGYHENPADHKFDPPGSQTLDKRSLAPILARYSDPGEVEKAFQSLQQYWAALLDRFQVSTPDVHTNRMVNIWNPYQDMVTFNLARSASYFESGISRGIGFRDSNQDLLGGVHLVPERARQRLLDLASIQLPDGGAYHQYQPLTKLGNNDIGSGFNDDPLWLILATAAYLKETGDVSILETAVPYDRNPGTDEPLYAHLARALRYTLDRLGPHDLPLIGRADWNDCLNLNCHSETPGQSFQTGANADGAVAESILIAGLFIWAARELAAIARHLRRTDDVVFWQAAAEKMALAVWESGWDGEWFRRAYDYLSRPIGSRECKEGQIFIEPQGICILAGLGLADGRAERALDSVAARLGTPHGLILLDPPYTQYQSHLGEISSYPPGYKENGSVFCQTNPWIMIAEAKLGLGDRAFDYYLRINPSAREDLSEVHRCEPYVYAQMIAGRHARVPGEAKNSWLTAAAAWDYVAITQWILGIRPTLNGLLVAPVLPSAWTGYQATRLYRGVRYKISVERHGPGPEVSLQVDGEAVAGNLVPLPPAGTKEASVVVRLG